jgi:hypothetical protein
VKALREPITDQENKKGSPVGRRVQGRT